MFCADTMPRTHDSTLEQRKCRFHGVCVNVAVHVNLCPGGEQFCVCRDCLDRARPVKRFPKSPIVSTKGNNTQIVPASSMLIASVVRPVLKG
jgi:hypothetical protein